MHESAKIKKGDPFRINCVKAFLIATQVVLTIVLMIWHLRVKLDASGNKTEWHCLVRRGNDKPIPYLKGNLESHHLNPRVTDITQSVAALVNMYMIMLFIEIPVYSICLQFLLHSAKKEINPAKIESRTNGIVAFLYIDTFLHCLRIFSIIAVMCTHPA